MERVNRDTRESERERARERESRDKEERDKEVTDVVDLAVELRAVREGGQCHCSNEGGKLRTKATHERNAGS